MDVNSPFLGLQQEGRGTYSAKVFWVGVGGFSGIRYKNYFHVQPPCWNWLRARQPWKMAFSQGRYIFSVRYSWAGKNPSGPGDLKGLKDLIAHLMRSGFQILSIL